jgi:protein SCO1/2
VANAKQIRHNKKWLLMLLLDAVIIIALVLYFGMRHHSPVHNVKIQGVYLPLPVAIAPFHLTDNHGKIFTNENLKGHWTMLFFGFTNCGFVCPTTLTELNKMYQQLQNKLSKNNLPQVIFISVDPARDTVKRINEYVTAFNPQFIGLRGKESATEKLENELHIMAEKMQTSRKGKNNYTIDHTAEILLINPAGQLQAYMSYPHTAEQMIKDYNLILGSNNVIT